MAYYVYMLCCGDGSLYTGSTNDVERRLRAYQSGKGAKYTRSHPPVTLVYQEMAEDRGAALRREAAIKRLTRLEKLALIGEEESKKMEMRRKDREMSAEFAWTIVDKCEYACLAMTAEDGTPYCLPVTIAREGNDIYFHSAMEGRKVNCLRQNPRVCLSCVGDTHIQEEKFTTLYESAVAFGTAAEVTEDGEKIDALRRICLRHTPHAMDGFDKAIGASLHRTAIWRITVEEITGKSKR